MKPRLAETLRIAAPYLVTAGAWVLAAYIKSRRFNKLTGQNVTTLDAMVIPLTISK